MNLETNLFRGWPTPNDIDVSGNGHTLVMYQYYIDSLTVDYTRDILLTISVWRSRDNINQFRAEAEVTIEGSVAEDITTVTLATINLPIVDGVIDRTPILAYLANNQLLELGKSLQAFSDRLKG